MKTFGLWALGIVGGLAAILGLIYALGGLKFITADFRGDVAVNERVSADAAYRIAAYEWFYDQCAAVQTAQQQIAVQEAELDTVASGSYREGQIHTNLTGLNAVLVGLVAEYNAEARKADTAANFRASDLPYEIDLDMGEVTCEN